MKTLYLVVMMFLSVAANADVYDLPPCYTTIPTTCTFDEMTLAMCNANGKKLGIRFLISQKIYITGGNKFGSTDGQSVCTVKRIKGTEPAKYDVIITK